jgi:hypothetical protein
VNQGMPRPEQGRRILKGNFTRFLTDKDPVKEKGQSLKNLNEHHRGAIEEHILEFFSGLSSKKKCIEHSLSMFCAFSFNAK